MKKNILPAALISLGLISLVLYFFNFGKDDLNIKVSQASYIMPSVYKVYSNEQALNGEYYFFKMLITNNGGSAMHDVKVSYQVPGYIDLTELHTVPIIYPGQHVVVKCYPHFKDNIVQKMTQSQENCEIRIEYNGGKIKRQSFTFNMMGRNQFVYTDIPPDEVTSYPDMMHNTQLLPCLVTPEDPIVKYYTAQVQDKLMHGEAASVSGKPEDARDFLLGLYRATFVSGMVYSGTEGIPQKLGDISSTVQSARLPREVITGNTGLCIELSLFYASVLKAAGLHPVIFLIPGHAYPGVLVNNVFYAIEATGVNGQGLGGRLTDVQALNRGMEELKTFMEASQQGDRRYIYIDVNDLEAKGVIPMELTDDDFLRKKVDDISNTFVRGSSATSSATTATSNTGNTRRSSGYATATYSGQISFSYPASWTRHDYPVPQVSILASQIQASDQTAISVWNVSAANPDQALYAIRTQLAAYGQYVSYQKTNQANGYTLYQGVTKYNGNERRWEGVFRNGGNGVVGITMGSPDFNGKVNLFNSIISSVH